MPASKWRQSCLGNLSNTILADYLAMRGTRASAANMTKQVKVGDFWQKKTFLELLGRS